MNTPQIKFFDPKEKPLTTVNHWEVILFCRRNNNAVTSRMTFMWPSLTSQIITLFFQIFWPWNFIPSLS